MNHTIKSAYLLAKNILNYFRGMEICLTNHAFNKLLLASKAANPKETGGLLLGWWNGNKIVIVDVVEVVDPNASEISWTRYQKSSQKSLDHALKQSPDERIGYVGDWHSHPKSCEASGIDLRSLSKASKQYSEPLALLIVLPNKKIYAYTSKDQVKIPIKIEEIPNA